jgi:DNA-binding NarL/FixJ family response regulator
MVIRILMVDDHEMIGHSISMFLNAQPNIEVIHIATTAKEGIQKAAALQPDVILMDKNLPDMNGYRATSRILKGNNHAAVIMLSLDEGALFVEQAFQHGAMGYLSKSCASKDLLEAVHTVYGGERYIYPEFERKLQQDIYTYAIHKKQLLNVLTLKQKRIYQTFVYGYSRVSMADLFAISPNTVDRHLQNIKAKLNLDTTAELIRFGLEAGLLDMDLGVTLGPQEDAPQS